MQFGDISFSVASHAAWVPGVDSAQAWQQWVNCTGHGDGVAAGSAEPAVKCMPPMLRRRASPAGKIALETAYAAHPQADGCNQDDIPLIFASRHGECARSVELLQELVDGAPLSPTSFSLSVHNANAGLFSIARGMRGNGIAVAAGASTVEHALIEACGLLADGAPQVLVVMADGPLPSVFAHFRDNNEQAFGWAWLIQGADELAALPTLSLQWSSADQSDLPSVPTEVLPGGIQVLRFFLSGAAAPDLVRHADGRRWHWMRHA